MFTEREQAGFVNKPCSYQECLFAYQRIGNILKENTDDAETSKMAVIMIEYFDNTLADNWRLLVEVRKGFEGE